MEDFMSRRTRNRRPSIFIKEDLLVIPGILCFIAPFIFDDPVFEELAMGVGIPMVFIWYIVILVKLNDTDKKT